MLLKSTCVVGIAFAMSIFAVVVFTGAEEVRADCGPCQLFLMTPEELLEESDYVFLGVVVDVVNEGLRYECRGSDLLVKELSGGGPDLSAQIRVNTVWKGSVAETVFIRGGGECGYRFSVGDGYLIYANGDGGRLSASYCGVVRAYQADEHYEALGPGWAPEPGSIAGTQSQLAIAPTCPTATPTPTETATTTPTPTITPVPTVTPTNTSTPTLTPTQLPTSTPVPTHTATKTLTPTLTPTPTPTPVPTAKPTNTSTSSTVRTSIAASTPIPQPSSTNGSCNVVARVTNSPFDTAPLALFAGIAWFGFRRRWPR